MNESQWEGAQDFLNDKISEYISNHLDEIVRDNEDAVREILEEIDSEKVAKKEEQE